MTEVEVSIGSSNEEEPKACEGCFMNSDAPARADECALVDALETSFTPSVSQTIVDILGSTEPISMNQYGDNFQERYPDLKQSTLRQRFSKAISAIRKSDALSRLVLSGSGGNGSKVYSADKSLIPELCPVIIKESRRKKKTKSRTKNPEINPGVSEDLSSMIFEYIKDGSIDDRALVELVQGIDSESHTLSLRKAMTRAIHSPQYPKALEMQDRFRKIAGIADSGTVLSLVSPEILSELTNNSEPTKVDA